MKLHKTKVENGHLKFDAEKYASGCPTETDKAGPKAKKVRVI